MTKYYKGFNKDMTCRGFQFEEGKTYETDRAKLCESGFHACEMPLDCFGYYAPADSVYHEVELDGVSDEREGDTKVCAKKIKVGAKLDIAGIVKASIDYIFAKTEKKGEKVIADSSNYASIGSSGNYASIGSSGYSASIGSSGYSASIEVKGENSVAMCAGANGRIKAKLGCWITLTEWTCTGAQRVPVCVRSAQIDGEKLKPNTWYKLKNGEFVEVEANE